MNAADVAAGVADEKAKKDAAGVIAALEALCRVRPGFAEAYAIATDPAKAAAARDAAERGTCDSAESARMDRTRRRRRGGLLGALPGRLPASGGVRRPADVRRAMVRGTRRGRGDAVRRIRRRLRFPRSRGVRFARDRRRGAAAAGDAGDALPEDVDRTWAKSEWVEAMDALGVTYRSTHAPLASLGRSWKVCWVADALDAGGAAVFLWGTRAKRLLHAGSLAAATPQTPRAEGGAPAPVEAAIRAVVGVAKSTPAPLV